MAQTEAQKARRRELRDENLMGALHSVKAELMALHREAVKVSMAFSEILERRGRIYQRPAYLLLTQYYQSQVQGYWEALFDLTYREHLEWRLTLPDGSWAEAGAFPYGQVDLRSYEILGAHFWKGTDVPYDNAGPA
jgi:hypothetical protein